MSDEHLMKELRDIAELISAMQLSIQDLFEALQRQPGIDATYLRDHFCAAVARRAAVSTSDGCRKVLSAWARSLGGPDTPPEERSS